MPERTCIACRKKGEPGQFFRMVAGPGNEVFVELDSRLPGRGAYCCVSPGCLEKVLNLKNLERSLRAKVSMPEAGELTLNIRALLKKRMESLLGAAWRKKVVAAGRDAALRAARSEKEGYLFLAEDLSPGSRSEVNGESPVPTEELHMTMAEVGEVFGRRPVGVFFVSDGSLAGSMELRNSQIRSFKVA